MDRDGLASSGDVEADLVFELGGDPFAAPPLDLFDIDLGKDAGHPERLTTSAGQGSTFKSVIRGLGERCRFVPSELGHRGLRQVATLGHLPLVMGLDHHCGHQAFDRLVVREDPDHVGAPLDLSMESLEGVRRPDLAPVGFGKRREGQQNPL